MTRRTQENLVAGLILCLFIGTIIAASAYGPRARLVPIPIAAIGALLIIGQIVLQNFRSEKDLQIDVLHMITTTPDVAGEIEEAAEEEKAPEGIGFLRELKALALVLGLGGLFLLVGPLPAMFVFTAAYFILSRYTGIVGGIAYSFLATASVYLLFHVWLRVDMRVGLIDINFGLW